MKAVITRVRERRRTVIDAAMAFIAIILVTQIWLLTATLEAYLAGHAEVALPGMLASAVLSAGCFGLYRFVQVTDKAPPHEPPR